MNERILVVDDEESIRYTFKVFLADEGYTVACACNYSEALACLEKKPFDLIYADIIMDNGTGIDLLKRTRELCPEVPVIMITGRPNVETATEALRNGALDYIVKPILQDDLIHSAIKALRHKALSHQKERSRLNFEAIFRSVNDGIINVNKNMDVIEINEAASRICGINRKAAINKPFRPTSIRCQGTCRELLNEVFTSLRPLKARRIECYSDNMKKQMVNIAVSPVTNQKGDFTGAVLMFRDEAYSFGHYRTSKESRMVIGKSEEMRKVDQLINDLADVHTTVLVTGETGTGKELVVEELHRRGPRRRKPLIKVNCAALSENLLETELFGHVAGAFTGAFKDKAGRFQRADNGTLFLDEIGEISPQVQLRLLRFLETMEFERVGDTKTMRVDVRVVAATNQDLEQKVAQREFRQDLYYRLKIMEIKLPPLRRRKEDIPQLIDYFLTFHNKKFNKTVRLISDDSRNLLTNYHWPGNVRELRNVLEYAVFHCHTEKIGVEHLPEEVMKFHMKIRNTESQDMENEARRIQLILAQTRWNKSKAAKLLGISRRTIYRKMDKYSIPHS